MTDEEVNFWYELNLSSFGSSEIIAKRFIKEFFEMEANAIRERKIRRELEQQLIDIKRILVRNI